MISFKDFRQARLCMLQSLVSVLCNRCLQCLLRQLTDRINRMHGSETIVIVNANAKKKEE